MTTMPLNMIHEQHNNGSGVSMLEYVVNAARIQGTQIPTNLYDDDGNQLPLPKIPAELYRGLWVGRCPECSGACAVTTTNPVYFCPDCGAGWFEITFPKNQTAIEAEVMKRPTVRGRMVFANWKPYGGVNYRLKPTGKAESLAQLERETTALLIIEAAKEGK